jgi:PEGA domain
MFMHISQRSKSNSMKRFSFLFGLTLLILPGLVGIVSADVLNQTTEIMTTAAATEAPDRIGGSIYFETFPPGAMIWLDTREIGTSPFTYYSENTGDFDVRIERKGYEVYTRRVTVSDGQRVVFSAVLVPVTLSPVDERTTVAPVTTVTTIRKSTMTLPTPWPTSPQSPGDPAVVIGAAALGIGLFAIRRR